MNDPLYNHVVFGPNKGKGGIIGKSDDQLIQDLIAIHNAENWLGMDGDAELSMFNKHDATKDDIDNPTKKSNGDFNESSSSNGSDAATNSPSSVNSFNGTGTNSSRKESS